MKRWLNLSLEELRSLMEEIGQPPHRANQIWTWVWTKFITDIQRMTDLPKKWRDELQNDLVLLPLRIIDSLEEEESVKLLFETLDGHHIEAVILKQDEATEESDDPKKRLTLCVSSQAGCPLGCVFCATGKLGFARNLEVDEILAQVILAEEFILQHPGLFGLSLTTPRKISNIVFMGMGEPFLNWENVQKAIRTLTHPKGYNLGYRHITISTAGIIEGIREFTQWNQPVRLAVSLHSPFRIGRERLMPIAKTNPLDDLMEALREYQDATGRRITFEYILIAGVNDRREDAEGLRKLLLPFKYLLNIIPYNPVEGIDLETPSQGRVKTFLLFLKEAGIHATLRKSRGRKIAAGCGQLGLLWKNREIRL
ncbi:putative dual-specificity RNA methyltransferase RlmN [Brevinematales bacterium NS]|nr:23S rRNA (adenine(2503)-C(2))-methyltransferase RlmN [Brevinematales bacterium]QJR22343.1 putative dual-specificity RNA methyltransferase RlmN [Brevinematales bacterium NS]